MSLVKNKDKRTGITYVYESESYWDKEKKQPRSKRTLIGRLNEETGEIIPTDGRGRKRKDKNTSLDSDGPNDQKYLEQIKEKDALIAQLTAENKELKKKLTAFTSDIQKVIDKHSK